MTKLLSSDALFDLIEQIAKTSSRNEKEALIAALPKDELVTMVLRHAYDPFLTYGVSPKKLTSGDRGDFSSDTFTLLGNLSRRTLTGNAAMDAINTHARMLSEKSAELLRRILVKDLRAGFTDSTINRVMPGLIPSFDCMLAHKFDEKRIKVWPAAVEPKLDGVRVICLVRDGRAKFFSRTGKPFPAVEHLAEAVETMIANSINLFTEPLSKWNIMFDGEIVSGSFNKTVSEVRRKSDAALDAVYHMFDTLPLATFLDASQKVAKLTYKVRRHVLEAIVKNATSPALKTTPRYVVSSVDEIVEFYDKFQARGLEGAIVKPLEGFYHKKRAHDWMKMKAQETEDLPVISAFEGEGKYVDMLGGLIIDRKGVQVRIGGGFSDEQRQEFWQAWLEDKARAHASDPHVFTLIGRLIEVEYHEVTPGGSLRHPRFVRFRDDKDKREAA